MSGPAPRSLLVTVLLLLAGAPARAAPTTSSDADADAEQVDADAEQADAEQADAEQATDAATAAPTASPSIRRPPPVARVIAVALARAGLEERAGAAMARRARWAGLAPWLTVRTLHRRSWSEDEPGIDRGDTLELRATWRLDRLVFDDAEVRARGVDDGRAKARRELARLVIRLYHRWLRLAAGGEATARAEVEAELDDLTAGWFGRMTRAPRR